MFNPVVSIIEKDGEYIIEEGNIDKSIILERFIDSAIFLREEYLREEYDNIKNQNGGE